MTRHTVALLLLALLLLLLGQLFIGRGSLQNVARMQQSLEELNASNAQARLTNERLSSEVRDLKDGLETVEERARMELGMVKPDEIFVQLSR